MALARKTAGKIIDLVAADVNCQRAIQPESNTDFLWVMQDLALEFTHTAGAFRNLAMIFSGKGPGDPTFDERICLGIALVTANAIRKGNLPEVRSVATCHRVHWWVHHEATWVRMRDESEFVFDWHATLTIRDPAISRLENWIDAKMAVNYRIFLGFK